MPTTFVTGGSGYVGATVIDRLLAQGHKVIGAFRSQSSADKLLSVHPEWDQSRIAVVEILDFSKSDAFDNGFKQHSDIDYVVHVAAAVIPPGVTDFVEFYEKPTVQGQIYLLESLKKFGKNVKAVSVTGSINAITTGAQDDVKSRVLHSSQWLPLGRKEAIELQNAFISYCVSKKLAEEAIWKFIDTEKPAFTVTVVNPPLIFGPVQQYVPTTSDLNLSSGLVYSILNSAKSETGIVPNTVFPGWIDVRDVAEVQIQALTNPKAANKRFIIGQPIKFDTLADSLRKLPGLGERVGKNNDEDITLPRFDARDAQDVFGIKWKIVDETMKDAVDSFLRLEAKSKA